MRNILLAGTTGLFLALGAASAYAVPQNSPYATMVPPGAVDGDAGPYGQQYPAYPDSGYPDGYMTEGRSAYVDPAYVDGDPGYVDPGYDYGYYGAPIGGGFYYGGGRGGGHFGGGHGGHFGGGGHARVR